MNLITPENESTLFDTLDRLQNHDDGVLQSGLRDDELKQSIANTLQAMDETALNQLLARYLRRFLTDEAIAEGHSIETVARSIRWLDEELDISY